MVILIINDAWRLKMSVKRITLKSIIDRIEEELEEYQNLSKQFPKKVSYKNKVKELERRLKRNKQLLKEAK